MQIAVTTTITPIARNMRKARHESRGLGIQMAPEGDAMIARGLYLSMKRSGKASLCWMLDWPLFYEQPFTRIKARALNEFLGAKLAPDCILMHGVRAVNWRNVSMDSGAYLADGVNL